MRILLIAYHYPPDPAVGSLRAEKVARTLSQAGHDVTVIAGNQGEKRGSRDRIGNSGETIHPVSTPSLRDVLARLMKVLRGWRPASETTDQTKMVGENDRTVEGVAQDNRSVSPLRRWIFSLLWLPDDRQGFIVTSLRRAWQLRGSSFDIVYSTAPPFSGHLAGLLISRILGTLLVAEFRDPWTRNPWKPTMVRSRLSDRVENFLEFLCVGQADLVVALTEGIASTLPFDDERRPLIIRNGIDVLQCADDAPRSAQRIRLLYVGSLYHTRDPMPILEALAEYRRSEAHRDTEIQLEFLGTGTRYAGQSLAEKIEDLGLSDCVSIGERLPHNECVWRISASDALLLLATGQPLQVPNKLYEYLGARRPILAVADRDGESWRMLSSVGGHTLVGTNQPRALLDGLVQLRDSFVAAKGKAIGDETILRTWLAEEQLRVLVREVEALRVD